MKKINWKKYLVEFLSIFIAVISAFALNNWNDNRKDNLSEEKILTEISNGIKLDLNDFSHNMINHKKSLESNNFFRDVLENKELDQDSIQFHYLRLFRDYVPVINLSGYQSLEASGLQIIKNDSLRFEIISLYGFYYSIMEKLEEEIPEMQSYPNYYKSINDLLHPFMEFNEAGELLSINPPINISAKEKKEILSYLWRLDSNRKYKIARYELVIGKMKLLKNNIEEELK